MKNNPYTDGLRVRVFDIETSGLFPNTASIISASLIDPDGSRLVQLYAEDTADEARLLRDLCAELSDCDALITYNGNRFDLPFVTNRLRRLHIAEELPILWSIDLYKWLKTYWPLSKTMEHLRQKDVEEALGLRDARTDTISGDECISLYQLWLQTGNEEARRKILLHNGDDVRQLAAISQNLSFLPWHRIAFEEGFFLRKNGEPCRVYGNAWERGIFRIRAKMKPWNIPASFFEDEFDLEYDSATGRAELVIRPDARDGRSFVDLRRMPVNEADLEALAGFHEGFLVLLDGGKLCYQEINRLTAALLETIV